MPLDECLRTTGLIVCLAIVPETVSGTNLWLQASVDLTNYLEKINPPSGVVVQTMAVGEGKIPGGTSGASLAYGGGSLWLQANVGTANYIEKIDLGSGAVLQTITVTGGKIPGGTSGASLAYGGGSLWLQANVDSANYIERIDPGSGAVLQTIAVTGGKFPLGTSGIGLAYGGGSLWLQANVDSANYFERIDPASGAVLQRITVGGGGIPGGTSGASTAYGAGNLWLQASVGSANSFERIDPLSGVVLETKTVAGGKIPHGTSGASIACEQPWYVSTSESPDNSGSTSGGGAFDDGATVTVTATANPCFRFENWTVDGNEVSTSPSFSFVAAMHQTLVANFAAGAYALVLSNSPLSGGLSSGSGSFDCGSSQPIAASAKAGYVFNGWIGSGAGSYTGPNNPATVTMNGPILEIANYLAVRSPSITSLSFSGANLTLKGANGIPGGTYFVLMSTNLTLPLEQWTPVATNVLIAAGNFSIELADGLGNHAPPRFYSLRLR